MRTMNISRLTLLLAFCGLFLLPACEKEVPFEGEDVEPVLVINSLFDPDSLWAVHLSRSRNVLDDGPYDDVANGQLRVYDGAGALVTQLSPGANGWYYSATEKPLANTSYRIEAVAPGYETASSTDLVPTPVQVTGLDTSSYADPQGGLSLDIGLNFDDPAGVENFYIIDVTILQTYVFDQDTFTYSYSAGLTCSDPNVEQDNAFEFGGGQSYFEYLLLRDQAIDGNSYRLDFTVPDLYIDEFGSMKLYINLYSASEALFRYRKSYAAYSATAGNPFAQPVQIYSNVDGGFGIFAGGVRSSWLLEF